MTKRVRKFDDPAASDENNKAEAEDESEDTATDEGAQDGADVEPPPPPDDVKAVDGDTSSATRDPLAIPALSDETKQLISSWFVDIRAPPERAATHFVPRALLLSIYALVDAEHRLHVNELFRRLPSTVINDGLTTLRILRFIDFDGATITLLRLPEVKA